MKFHVSKISAVVASAAAASQADSAAAQTTAPFVPGPWTVTVEGGVAFSNFSNSAYPAGAVPFIPQDTDKIGSTPLSSGNLNPGQRIGGYGSFSVARNINPVNDWRFSAGFNVFGSGDHSATASEGFSGDGFSGTNTAGITENDRFGLYTADFDFGRHWSAGVFQFRTFVGLRALYTNDRFESVLNTSGTDKVGFETNSTTLTNGSSIGHSEYFGLGPRAGIDFSTGAKFGFVGGFSAALLEGYRQSSYSTTSSAVTDGGAPVVSGTLTTLNEPSWVGNLSGNLGVSWQFSPTGQLVVGYKIDQWFNVRESFAFAGFDKKQDVLIQTPFIRATIRF
jgi:Legionella pneumophila major outer membrane protein precursor